jgi:hypothetical protein
MIDKLPPSQERKIIRGIEKAIAYTRSGSSPNDALVKVATEMAFTPEITKRACEAFNKSKTVHVLTNRKSENRAESFDHADPAEVVKSIFGNTEKKASLELPRKDFSFVGMSTTVFQKSASAAKTEPEEAPRTDIFKEGSGIEYRRDMQTRMELLDNFDRQKSLTNQARLLTEESIMKAAENMRYMKDKELKKVAHVVVNRFGTSGAKMLQVVGAKIQRDLPLQKTANGAVLPLQSPYPELDQAIRYARGYSEHKDLLTKMAKEAENFFFEKKAAPTGSDVGEAGKFLMTAAPGFALGAANKAVRGGFGVLHDEVSKWKDIVQTDSKKKLNKILDPSFMASVDRLDNMKGWVNVAADPAIKNYPIQDITEAYNNIINVSPALRDPAMQPALKSMVRRQLAQKQLMDPAEVTQLAELEKNYSDALKKRMEVQKMREEEQLPAPANQYDLEKILGIKTQEEREKASDRSATLGSNIATAMDQGVKQSESNRIAEGLSVKRVEKEIKDQAREEGYVDPIGDAVQTAEDEIATQSALYDAGHVDEFGNKDTEPTDIESTPEQIVAKEQQDEVDTLDAEKKIYGPEGKPEKGAEWSSLDPTVEEEAEEASNALARGQAVDIATEEALKEKGIDQDAGDYEDVPLTAEEQATQNVEGIANQQSVDIATEEALRDAGVDRDAGDYEDVPEGALTRMLRAGQEDADQLDAEAQTPETQNSDWQNIPNTPEQTAANTIQAEQEAIQTEDATIRQRRDADIGGPDTNWQNVQEAPDVQADATDDALANGINNALRISGQHYGEALADVQNRMTRYNPGDPEYPDGWELQLLSPETQRLRAEGRIL